jgi:Lambda phage tail tube protein, TTP
MAKYVGRGGMLGVESAVPGTFTDIAQISSIGSVAITSDEVEVTTLDNTSGFREYLQTFKDAGELPITIVWDPALPTHGEGADGLWGLMESGVLKNWQITFPTTPPYTAEFAGFVKSFPTPALTPDDALTADITIRVSGTVTLVAGTLTQVGAPLPTRQPLPPPPQRRGQVDTRTLGD